MAKLKEIIAAKILGIRGSQDFSGGSSVVDSTVAWNNMLTLPEFSDPVGLLSEWDRGWASPPVTLSILHHITKLSAPTTVIETGTLAAHSTMAMATALQELGKPARIFTHDYDGDPVTEDIPLNEWKGLAEIRSENLKRIRAYCPLVEIEFVDGDTRETLHATVQKSGGVDFWFQDSMHYKEGIYQEWDILKPHINPGAVLGFDNVDHQHAFGRDFVRNVITSDWSYQTAIPGRNRQIWCRVPYVGGV